MIVLGIETSCDETSVALVEDGREILSNLVATQIDLHRTFGGVVPEVASREHLRVLAPMLGEAMREAGVGREAVDGVAFTRGPGLIGALLVGTSFGKALACSWGVPPIGVNHLKAHLYAPLLEGGVFEFPLAGLIVSGGHTLLVEARSWDEARILGATRDDAAGEAFDKVAGLLGIGFPGGPAIEAAARGGDPGKFQFPRGMIGSGDLDFSFSGVKTAVRYLLDRLKADGLPVPTADIAAGFQAAVIDVLTAKFKVAVEETGARTVVLGGGVARNELLRRRVQAEFPSSRYRVLIASAELCSDNAAMIAGLGCRILKKGGGGDWTVDADPNLAWGDGMV
ncbi:MAG: tRNA (adenosine(37)-N6)-threonylcarbamoyltransferase complex transferase subunit TsaD [PVC group bacterium]